MMGQDNGSRSSSVSKSMSVSMSMYSSRENSLGDNWSDMYLWCYCGCRVNNVSVGVMVNMRKNMGCVNWPESVIDVNTGQSSGCCGSYGQNTGNNNLKDNHSPVQGNSDEAVDGGSNRYSLDI
ncbi:GSCOCG00007272001-RA-CDS, partial [Cotesia congregata]